MTNSQVAGIFRELAEILQTKKENWFKIRSYRKVADEIEKLPIDLKQLVNEQRLQQIPGVGDAIENKIVEILTTGKLQLLERLKAETVEKTVE